ncbi:type I restriction enzyme endonuclease domain-containing protein [Sorangium sp. So ce542]|uniref:type I restriction enzyme endonuclease domain-containing protein n=1 Tax=Sorangium sp. So ce542 TaxID=3133316 RepID=UPI003F61110B
MARALRHTSADGSCPPSGRCRSAVPRFGRIASLLEEQIEPRVSLVDWAHRGDVQREMRRRIKRQLRAAGFAGDKIDATADSIVEFMKRRRGR